MSPVKEGQEVQERHECSAGVVALELMLLASLGFISSELRSTARMQIADRIHTDPRDLSADQADRILGADRRRYLI